ncbi:hypothetical protein EJ04DRAFT_443582 [Polyplosphaeria fusca]|uniref:Glutaredoxin-like protein n=1 Tax=Polyplosphaeria fusca TaxID=682080 RepID=A0A9P4QPB5_9PLEO|nr:hypothetical protein EJ04DRAFT_443582 [Polyplosphaeria fusca]
MFRASPRLLKCRITLFTRVNCSLCDTAKSVVGGVGNKRAFDYKEIDVLEPGQEKWKSVYEFDTPVIHVDKSNSTATTPASQKLMHRFKEEAVVELMDRVDRS